MSNLAISPSRRRLLLAEWDDARDEMHDIERAALLYLNALDIRRRSSYSSAAVKQIDGHGAEFADRTLELLSDMHAAFQRRLDDECVDPDSVTYDDSMLRADATEWNARAEARR